MKVAPTKAHVAIYRAVDGAVRNVAHHHPKWSASHPDIARSIAKRAAGTLTADWPDVLAARGVPSDADGPGYRGHWPPSRAARTRSGRGASSKPRRSPSSLRQIWNEISAMVTPARKAGNTERVAALVDVLKLIGGRLTQ
jgi:hypothetical protein